MLFASKILLCTIAAAMICPTTAMPVAPEMTSDKADTGNDAKFDADYGKDAKPDDSKDAKPDDSKDAQPDYGKDACDSALEKMAEFRAVCPKDCDKDRGDCKGDEQEFHTACRTTACAGFIAQHFKADTVSALLSCPAGAGLPPHWVADERAIWEDFKHVERSCTGSPQPAPPAPPTPTGKVFELKTFSAAGKVTGALGEGSRWEHEFDAERKGHGQMLNYATGKALLESVPAQVYFAAETEWAALRKKSEQGTYDAVLALESHGGIFEANNRVSFWGMVDHPEWGQLWKLEPATGNIIPQRNPQLCLGFGKVDPAYGFGADELILTTRDKCLRFSPVEEPSMRAVSDSVASVAAKVDGVADELRTRLEAQMIEIKNLERLIMEKASANTEPHAHVHPKDPAGNKGGTDTNVAAASASTTAGADKKGN